jgi:serine/threonine protein kinase
VTGERQSYAVGTDEDPDRYRLRRQVGDGGEAELWEAETAAPERERVAVKVLPPGPTDDPQWRERWAEQVELLRSVRHPGVARVRDAFEGARMHPPGLADPQEPARYLVSDWVDGEDLRSWVPRHRSPDDLDPALRLLGQVAAVLDALHSGQASRSGRPVVHGDLGPGNVIVDPAGQAVLVDFGVSRVAGRVAAAPAGTRGYCAPEVAQRGEYGPAADRYAFGGLAYYVLTGTHPPVDPRLAGGLAGIEALADEPVTQDELAAIFDPDPDRRPAAGDWLRRLRRQASTGAALAVPTDAPRPARRPRRARFVVAAGVALLAAVGLGVVLGAGPLSPGQADDPPVADASPTPSPNPSPTAAPTPSPTPTADPSPTRSPWPGEPPGTVYLTGTVELCSNCDDRAFDLDENRAIWIVVTRDTVDFTASREGLGAQNGAQFAPWEGLREPTLQDCRNLPDGDWSVPFIAADELEPPAIYCVQTSDGRFGHLQSRLVDLDIQGRPTRYDFSYVLWTAPDDQ